MSSSSTLRNFCIIAHIDHGKSTLADRFLELTKTIDKRLMKEQVLDQMDLERERGITIKLQPVRMRYRVAGRDYILNLIDTPGHVDFSYEVSRSLAAVEGALLVVDASQGVEAQTLTNLYFALEQNLTLIPVINKIDLPNAQVDKVRKELVHILGCNPEEIVLVSAKTGQGVENLLKEIVQRVPAPRIDSDGHLRALVFDSYYDDYRGVVAYVRLMSGSLQKGQVIHPLSTKKPSEALEVGFFSPHLQPSSELSSGEIGYIVTGFKGVEDCRVGDTLSLAKDSDAQPLSGYKQVKPMVFAGIYCKDSSDYEALREAVGKLKLNDAALVYSPHHSSALGFGFQCGFLGLLHLEIFQERLTREYKLNLIVTAPSVVYRLKLLQGRTSEISTPSEWPEPFSIQEVCEPWVKMELIAPDDRVGVIMMLMKHKRAVYRSMEYLEEKRVLLYYEVPLASILVDFYDKLKSVSSGYASVNYEFIDFRPADVVRLDILAAGDLIEPLSSIVYRDEAYRVAREILKRLKDVLPRQMFEVRLQAAVGGKVVASEKIPALRKDVTAKLYGGDVTRKRKLLEKQKKGKKRMRALGKVDIPQEAFFSLFKRL